MVIELLEYKLSQLRLYTVENNQAVASYQSICFGYILSLCLAN